MDDADSSVSDLRVRAMEELLNLATFNPDVFFTPEGVLRRWEEIPNSAKACIKKYQRKPDGTITIQWIDRARIFDLVLRHCDMLERM